MRAHHLPPRLPLAVPVLWVAALLAICCSGTAIAAVQLFEALRQAEATQHPARRDLVREVQRRFSGTFRLHWKQSGSRLSGSIALSNPGGTYGISGSVHGSAIKFGAVGAGATYTGSVSGKSMSGSYKSPQGGGTWSAHKTS